MEKNLASTVSPPPPPPKTKQGQQHGLSVWWRKTLKQEVVTGKKPAQDPPFTQWTTGFLTVPWGPLDKAEPPLPRALPISLPPEPPPCPPSLSTLLTAALPPHHHVLKGQLRL